MKKVFPIRPVLIASALLFHASHSLSVNAASMIPMPSGSYQQTCRSISLDGYLLSAVCRRLHSGWKSTSVDTRGCTGEIENWDGRLSCADLSDRGSVLEDIPNGSYTQSCTRISTNKGMLSAQCRSISGVWKRTSIVRNQCQNFSNKDGQLVCE